MKARFWAFSPSRCTGTTWSCAAAGVRPSRCSRAPRGARSRGFHHASGEKDPHAARGSSRRAPIGAAGVTGAGERQEPGGGGQADALRPYVGQGSRSAGPTEVLVAADSPQAFLASGWRATDAGRPTGCSGFRPRPPRPKALLPREARVPRAARRRRGHSCARSCRSRSRISRMRRSSASSTRVRPQPLRRLARRGNGRQPAPVHPETTARTWPALTTIAGQARADLTIARRALIRRARSASAIPGASRSTLLGQEGLLRVLQADALVQGADRWLARTSEPRATVGSTADGRPAWRRRGRCRAPGTAPALHSSRADTGNENLIRSERFAAYSRRGVSTGSRRSRNRDCRPGGDGGRCDARARCVPGARHDRLLLQRLSAQEHRPRALHGQRLRTGTTEAPHDLGPLHAPLVAQGPVSSRSRILLAHRDSWRAERPRAPADQSLRRVR